MALATGNDSTGLLLPLKKILNVSIRPEPGSMADDDEIRKIIQATGGGEYNARLGEYRVSYSASFILRHGGLCPPHALFLLPGECACEVIGCVDRRVQ